MLVTLPSKDFSHHPSSLIRTSITDLLYYFQHIQNYLNKLFNTYLIIYLTIKQDHQPLQRTTKTTTTTVVTVTINCFTFYHVPQLPLADADLYWALGHCFVCGLHGHHSEACPSAQGELRLICDLLEDPFSE